VQIRTPRDSVSHRRDGACGHRFSLTVGATYGRMPLPLRDPAVDHALLNRTMGSTAGFLFAAYRPSKNWRRALRTARSLGHPPLGQNGCAAAFLAVFHQEIRAAESTAIARRSLRAPRFALLRHAGHGLHMRVFTAPSGARTRPSGTPTDGTAPTSIRTSTRRQRAQGWRPSALPPACTRGLVRRSPLPPCPKCEVHPCGISNDKGTLDHWLHEP